MTPTPDRWVAKASLRQVHRAFRPRWTSRAAERINRVSTQALRSGLPIIWLLPLSLMIYFTDVPLALLKDNSETAHQVVATVLTVIGAVQALAIAVFVFAAQIYLGSRLGQYDSLREWVRSTYFVILVNLGVVALLVGGVVIIDVPEGAASGWQGSWFLILSALFLLLLPVVVLLNIRAADPSLSAPRRLTALQELVQLETRKVAATSITERRLKERLAENDIDYLPGGPLFSARTNTAIASAHRSGLVRDIRLDRVKKAGAPFVRSNGGGEVQRDRFVYRSKHY